MPDNQLAPIACGFAGTTALLTTWGPCRLHELARLSARRAARALQFSQLNAARQQQHLQVLATFDLAASTIVQSVPDTDKAHTEELHSALRQSTATAQEQELATTFAAQIAELAAMLPSCLQGEGDPSVAIDALAAEPETVTELVEVVIADGVIVRCTGDCTFTTTEGPCHAAELTGQTIYRRFADASEDTFVVPSAAVVVLDTPIPVYRVLPSGAYWVGADSGVAVSVVF